MAWIEQTGQQAWRVRYQRDNGRYGSISGFSSKKAATDYANDLKSDRRRGRWIDPAAARIITSACQSCGWRPWTWKHAPRKLPRLPTQPHPPSLGLHRTG
jgi:hypothetical protein